MSTSFPFVQSATSVGPYTAPTAPTITINGVAYGNTLVATLGGEFYPQSGSVPPTGVTDSGGNTWTFCCASNGDDGNQGAQGSIWVATDVVGGNLTITFHTVGTTDPSWGPVNIIVGEWEVPDYFSVVALNNISQANDSDPFNGTMYFRSIANNGTTGGANCSDTGQVFVEAISDPYDNREDFQNYGIAFINPFLDVLLVMGVLDNEARFGTGWAVTNCTIRGATVGYGSGGGPETSSVLVDGYFPYLNGPLQAQCDNPPNGTVGTSYTHNLVAAGGTGGPYTFTQIGGMLPPGLTLATDGTISGTPTAAGKFLFSVQVTDGSSFVVIDCSIAICPAGGSGGGASNYGWTG